MKDLFSTLFSAKRLGSQSKKTFNNVVVCSVNKSSKDTGITHSFRNNGYQTFYMLLLSIIISVIIVSCGGCKGAKVATQVQENTVDSTDKIESVVNTPSSAANYPITDGIFSTINDSAQIVDGVQFVQTENGRKITFPNGKVISSDNFPIIRDLPKKYNKNPGEYYGFYDFSKISDSKKEALLFNMDGYDPKKLKNYTEAMFTFQQYSIYDDEYNKTKLERIFVITDLVIFEEIRRSEDDIQQIAIGRIAYMEIYDKQGNLLNEVSLDKYGCSEVCVTPDKKHIIVNSNGRDDDMELTMKNNGAIAIYSYENFELVDTILHFPNDFASGECGCTNNYIGLISQIPDSDSLHYLNMKINERIIFTLAFSNEKRYQVKFIHSKGGYYQFNDGTKIEKGNPNFRQYTLNEWNNYVRNNRIHDNVRE